MLSIEEKEYLYQERAGILEFEANLPRDEAERRAFAEIYGTQQGGLFEVPA